MITAIQHVCVVSNLGHDVEGSGSFRRQITGNQLNQKRKSEISTHNSLPLQSSSYKVSYTSEKFNVSYSTPEMVRSTSSVYDFQTSYLVSQTLKGLSKKIN